MNYRTVLFVLLLLSLHTPTGMALAFVIVAPLGALLMLGFAPAGSPRSVQYQFNDRPVAGVWTRR